MDYNTALTIVENITKSLAQDLCTMITLLCVGGEGGYPHIQMHADSQECFKCASQEELDVQAQKVLDTLDEQTQKSLNHSQNTEDMLAVMKASMDVMKASMDVMKSSMDKVLNTTGTARFLKVGFEQLF